MPDIKPIIDGVRKIAKTKQIEERLARLENTDTKGDKASIDEVKNIAVQIQNGNIRQTTGGVSDPPPPDDNDDDGSDTPDDQTPDPPPIIPGLDDQPPTIDDAYEYGTKGSGDPVLDELVSAMEAAGYSQEEIDAFVNNYLDSEYGEDGVYRAEDVLNRTWFENDYLKGILGFDPDDPSTVMGVRFDGQYNRIPGWPDPNTPGPATGYYNGIFWSHTYSTDTFDSVVEALNDLISSEPLIGSFVKWTTPAFANPDLAAAYLNTLPADSDGGATTSAEFVRATNPELGNFTLPITGRKCGRASGVPGDATCAVPPTATEWPSSNIFILSRVNGSIQANAFDPVVPLKYSSSPRSQVRIKVGDGTNITDARYIDISTVPSGGGYPLIKIEELSSDLSTVKSTKYFGTVPTSTPTPRIGS